MTGPCNSTDQVAACDDGQSRVNVTKSEETVNIVINFFIPCIATGFCVLGVS
jgi:hypothetical protein